MSADAGASEGRGPAGRWVAGLCWTAVALDGFDLVVLGAVFVFAVPRSPADEARRMGVSPEAATR